jgi:uncharacterized protein (DUF305 family)
MRKISLTIALVTLAAVGAGIHVVSTTAPVLAQSHSGHGGHAGHGAPAAKAQSTSPSTAAYEAVNAKMHKDMDIKFTGNADVDFIRGMIPHHQGAVEMAEVVLKHGKDPEVRKLAQEVIAAQKKEIAWMKAWLQKNAKTGN